MTDIDAVEFAAVHHVLDATLATLGAVMGINVPDFDAVHVDLGRFMAAVISGAASELDYYSGVA